MIPACVGHRRSTLFKAAALAATLLAVAFTAACGSGGGSPNNGASPSGPPPVAKVVVAQGAVIPFYAPIYVAQQQGYFQQESLDVNLQTVAAGATGIVNGVLGGSIQFGMAGSTAPVIASSKGAPVQIVGQIAVGADAVMAFSQSYAAKYGITAASSDADKLNALEHARIATSAAGSSTQVTLQYFFKKENIDTSHITIVPLSDTNAMVAAVTSGRADAILNGSQVVTNFVSKFQGVTVFNLGQDPQLGLQTMPLTVVVVTKSWAASHADVVRRYLKALSMALTYIRANPDAAGQIVATATKVTDDATFKATWAATMAQEPTSPSIDQSGFPALVSLVNIGQNLSITPTFDSIITNQYVS